MYIIKIKIYMLVGLHLMKFFFYTEFLLASDMFINSPCKPQQLLIMQVQCEVFFLCIGKLAIRTVHDYLW